MQVTATTDYGRIFRTLSQFVGLTLAACGTVGSILTIIFFLQGAPGGSTIDADFQRTTGPGQQHTRVTRIGARSPLTAYGVKVGDAVQFDRAVDDGKLQRNFQFGESIGMTLMGPHPRHIRVATVPQSSSSFTFLAILDNCTSLLSMAIGSLILLRSRRSNALTTLGLCFIAFAIYSTVLPLNQMPDVFFWYTTSWTIVQSFGVAVGFVLFAILFYRENIGPVSRRLWLAFWVYTAVFAVVTGGVTCLTMFNYALPLMVHSVTYGLVLTEAGFAAAFIGLVIGWRRSRQDLQKRYAIMCVAISMVIACDVMFSFQNLLYGGFGSVEYRALYIAAEWLSAAGHLLFAYAVLRDKVVDPGFVVNRAVVYGIISALLLVVFGLVEWGVEHVIPLESREKSALVDAAIALVIYLIFHRIKDSVERFIEKVLFHKWHHNEAALRRFVKEADFINDPDALLKAFVAELTRFAQGAGSAIYLQRHADSFDLAHGEDMAGLRIDDNAPFVVALRARHSAVEPEDHATAMALPLSHRGTLFGFAVLAAKPDGGSYRPDETEVLAWAAHQIGLDFHALKVEALESEAATLRQQNVTLASVITGALSKAPA